MIVCITGNALFAALTRHASIELGVAFGANITINKFIVDTGDTDLCCKAGGTVLRAREAIFCVWIEVSCALAKSEVRNLVRALIWSDDENVVGSLRQGQICTGFIEVEGKSQLKVLVGLSFHFKVHKWLGNDPPAHDSPIDYSSNILTISWDLNESGGVGRRDAGDKFGNLSRLVWVEIDTATDRTFVYGISIWRESNAEGVVGVDLLLGLSVSIDETKIATQLAYRADNDCCGLDDRPADGLDKMSELEIKNLIELGTFFIGGDSQDVCVFSDWYCNVVIGVDADWADWKKLVRFSVTDLVRPSWADGWIDDFVAEDTPFFCANDEQRVVMVEGDGWGTGAHFYLIDDWH